jgi:hypothetical protein
VNVKHSGRLDDRNNGTDPIRPSLHRTTDLGRDRPFAVPKYDAKNA